MRAGGTRKPRERAARRAGLTLHPAARGRRRGDDRAVLSRGGLRSSRHSCQLDQLRIVLLLTPLIMIGAMGPDDGDRGPPCRSVDRLDARLRRDGKRRALPVRRRPGSGWTVPWWTRHSVSIAVGALLGFGNGVLIQLFRLPAIIVTLGTLSLYRGLTFIISNAKQIDRQWIPSELKGAVADFDLRDPQGFPDRARVQHSVDRDHRVRCRGSHLSLPDAFADGPADLCHGLQSRRGAAARHRCDQDHAAGVHHLRCAVGAGGHSLCEPLGLR